MSETRKRLDTSSGHGVSEDRKGLRIVNLCSSGKVVSLVSTNYNKPCHWPEAQKATLSIQPSSHNTHESLLWVGQNSFLHILHPLKKVNGVSTTLRYSAGLVRILLMNRSKNPLKQCFLIEDQIKKALKMFDNKVK